MTSQTSWMDQIKKNSQEALQDLLQEKLTKAREGDGKTERQVLTAICQVLEEPGLQKLADHLEYGKSGNEAKHAQKWLSEWMHKADDKTLEKLAGLHPKVLVEAAQQALETLRFKDQEDDHGKLPRFNVLGFIGKFAVGLLVVSVVAFIAFQAGAKQLIGTPEETAVVSPGVSPARVTEAPVFTATPTGEPTGELTNDLTESQESVEPPETNTVALVGDVSLLDLVVALDTYPTPEPSAIPDPSATPDPAATSTPVPTPQIFLNGEMIFQATGASLEVAEDITDSITLEGTLTLYGAQNADGTYALTGRMPLSDYSTPEGGEDSPELSFELSGSNSGTQLEFSGTATFNGPLMGELPISLRLSISDEIVLGPIFVWRGNVSLTGTRLGDQMILSGVEVSLVAIALSEDPSAASLLQYSPNCDLQEITGIGNGLTPTFSWTCTITNKSGITLDLGVILDPRNRAPGSTYIYYQSRGYNYQFKPDSTGDYFELETDLPDEPEPMQAGEVIQLTTLDPDANTTFQVDVNCENGEQCSIYPLDIRLWLVFLNTTPPALIREFNFTANVQTPTSTP